MGRCCNDTHPDELQATIYKNHIEQRVKEGTSIAFAHGLNIHYDLIKARKDLDVFMVAPKGPGHLVKVSLKKVEVYHVYSLFIRMDLAMKHCYVLCFCNWGWQIRNY